jgi:hypothetical protein
MNSGLNIFNNNGKIVNDAIEDVHIVTAIRKPK